MRTGLDISSPPEENASMLKRIEIEHLAAGVLLVYTAVHIHEEAAGNFPLWMQENWGVPGITFGRWLFHNACFFVPALVAGLLVYLLNRDKMLPFGVGILIWGLLNSFEHTVFTIKNLAVSPGLFSGALFAVLAIGGGFKLQQMGRLKPKLLLTAFVIQAVFYWGLPMASFILLRDHIGDVVGG